MLRPLTALDRRRRGRGRGASRRHRLRATGTKLHVYVSNCEKQVYKPKTITVFCADAGVVIDKITYRPTAPRRPRARARPTSTSAIPTAPPARRRTTRSRFTLSKVKQCGDSYQFRKLRMTYTGAKPKGARTINQKFACADAPTR